MENKNGIAFHAVAREHSDINVFNGNSNDVVCDSTHRVSMHTYKCPKNRAFPEGIDIRFIYAVGFTMDFVVRSFFCLFCLACASVCCKVSSVSEVFRFPSMVSVVTKRLAPTQRLHIVVSNFHKATTHTGRHCLLNGCSCSCSCLLSLSLSLSPH